MKTEKITRCKRCGRQLKNPTAQELGMGAICYKKYLAEHTKRKLFDTTSN